MKTDDLFYEFFKSNPNKLFDLIGEKAEGIYQFQSITVKHTKKSLDGYLRRIDGPGFDVFAEFQGYGDRAVYFRIFRKVCTFYEQKSDAKEEDHQQQPLLVVVFLDETLDPGPGMFKNMPGCRLVRIHLANDLQFVRGYSR